MSRYNNIEIIKNVNENVGNLGAKYRKPTQYPEIADSEDDLYVITEFGDKLTALADRFYKDVNLYWIIGCANPNVINFDSIFIPIGTQLRIPLNISSIIDSYNQLNGV